MYCTRVQYTMQVNCTYIHFRLLSHDLKLFITAYNDLRFVTSLPSSQPLMIMCWKVLLIPADKLDNLSKNLGS
jgi:hypothetical protein